MLRPTPIRAVGPDTVDRRCAPVVLESPSQFRAPAPPALSSPEYAQAFNEVKTLGSATSTARTAAQTAIGQFWNANVIEQYNRVFREVATQHNFDLVDAGPPVRDGEHGRLGRRHRLHGLQVPPPALAPRHSDPQRGQGRQHGNRRKPRTWSSLPTTPNHPEYPSAHGCVTAAVTDVLTAALKTTAINIDVPGATGGGTTLTTARHFDTAAALLEDVANARIWAGLHYRFATTAGVEIGHQAQQVRPPTRIPTSQPLADSRCRGMASAIPLPHHRQISRAALRAPVRSRRAGRPDRPSPSSPGRRRTSTGSPCHSGKLRTWPGLAARIASITGSSSEASLTYLLGEERIGREPGITRPADRRVERRTGNPISRRDELRKLNRVRRSPGRRRRRRGCWRSRLRPPCGRRLPRPSPRRGRRARRCGARAPAPGRAPSRGARRELPAAPGSSPRSRSIISAGGATGTRSGSGK